MPLDGTSRGKPQPSKRTIALRLRREEQSAVALEIREAQAARRKGETRWEAAIKLGIKARVIPDFTTTPEPVGTNRVVYVDAKTQISLFVAEPIEGLDYLGFIADLLKAGFEPKVVKRLARKHRTETRPAHRLTSSPVG
jgi:hypothetical protein